MHACLRSKHSDECRRCLQEESNGSILVVGAQQVGKYSLVSRLLCPITAADKDSDKQQLWHLDTKYYTTDVSIHRLHPSQNALETAASCQGLVLVFTAETEASFSVVSQWAEQLPSTVGEIRLCVANKVDAIALQGNDAPGQQAMLQRSSWLDAVSVWCAENQFEYIEASSTNTQLDKDLVWEEQQQGVHRIRQALEANYWPNLSMKQPQLNHAELKPQSGQEPCLSAAGADIEQSSEAAGRFSDSCDEDDSLNAFQSAEEAELDQFDRMFGELRGEYVTLTCSNNSLWSVYHACLPSRVLLLLLALDQKSLA